MLEKKLSVISDNFQEKTQRALSEQIYRSVLQPNNFMSFAVNLDLKEIFLSELQKAEKMLSK